LIDRPASVPPVTSPQRSPAPGAEPDGPLARRFFKCAMPDQMEDAMVSQDFRRQLAGYGLTTAEIVYRRPDHPWLLQTYLWQDYDLFPNFPTLERFLAFWKNNLDGALHSVRVAHSRLIQPAEIRAVDGILRLH
jgi:uncharacterized protein Usg